MFGSKDNPIDGRDPRQAMELLTRARAAAAPHRPHLERIRAWVLGQVTSRQRDLSLLLSIQRGLVTLSQGYIDRWSATTACGAGCWWCCAQPVPVNDLEVFLLAATIAAEWSAEDRAALIERLRAYVARADGTSAAHINPLRLVCPLLVEGCCSVYGSRPNACQAMNSTSAEACQQGHASFWSHDLTAPRVLEYGVVINLVAAAAADALQQRGIVLGRYLLPHALLIALSEPDAKERWEVGEDVFAPAQLLA